MLSNCLLCLSAGACVPLDEALKQTVQDMGPEPHQAYVLRRAVRALTVHDWTLKHVTKLCLVTQEVRPHKVHHAPVLHQVILQWVSRQHNPPPAMSTAHVSLFTKQTLRLHQYTGH